MRELARTDESTFWYWIAERHGIYLKRFGGNVYWPEPQPKPWTDDPILQRYKFTNAFRQLDRGTVWLTENFIEPHREIPHDTQDCSAFSRYQFKITTYDCMCTASVHHFSTLAFNIFWYRMFNWYGTGALLGYLTEWNAEEVKAKLTEHLHFGGQVFTGAHIVYSRPGVPKIDAIVEVCSDLHHMAYEAGALVRCCREEKSLETVFNSLTQVHSVGGFMAYEMVSDLRHTPLLSDAHDIMTWANPGPGAKRGLQRLGLPYKRDAEAIESMRGLLARSKEGLAKAPGPTLMNVHVPDLEMRDIEHSLCEMDKYVRVLNGEGEPRGKFDGE